MAGVPQKTLSWLYDVLKREYHDPNRTYSDLAHVLARNPGFAPRTDVYTFENGISALLVHFKGTLPVNFRGITYRFPIALWIPHAYPYEAPLCYVTPTEDMIIRPGQHVGGDGKIYHPYLAHWRDAWDRSNILDFLSILSDVFAKEPPVMSRIQQNQRPVQPTPPPVPPLPREIQPPSPSTAPVSGPPLPPPPPPKQTAQDISIPEPTSSSLSSQKPSRYDGLPPLPPQAQSPNRAPSRPRHPYGNGNFQRPLSGLNYMPQRTSSLRQSMPPPQQQPEYEPQQFRPQPPGRESLQHPPDQPPPRSSGPMNPTPHQTYDQMGPSPNHHYPTESAHQGQNERPLSQHFPPGPTPQQQPHPYLHPQPPPFKQPPQIPKPNHTPTPNLLDSPFDIPLPAPTTTPGSNLAPTSNIPAPPIPVNPEKEALLTHLSHQITQSLHSQIAQSTSALPALSSQNAALQSTLHTLNNELSTLQTLHSTLTSNLNLLSTSLAKSDSVISSAQKRAAQNDIPPVDEMLVPPTVVARQLYDAACEERGIEAAILALQEGFVRGRVASDVWARRTRELAREGFKRRLMERKVARGMSLDLSAYGAGGVS
ncbi:uncharacterized protein Z518_06378 [Rhinocladiella mackenziei CBS 650.93]|uniref:Rhinocladiella mackenziei CBS 650.93 unplaced genomic scaffold supercont1.4, whole genome shotgun sequence n=1 Tax=Rhinocladiella mackenziei CBS 650.93 TaxID=1442369 RepID=A0A0D2IQT3_9EURO|nr:uncharacterized protein Z518_06378 [Rhinocladiella mackenziei CBS 650.93]KIX05506.1 hypothetical protein Z518_06378 [Rhinocladiella mackenziei CBS 650.93]